MAEHRLHHGLLEHVQEEVGDHDVVVARALVLEHIFADELEAPLGVHGLELARRTVEHPLRQVDQRQAHLAVRRQHRVLAVADAGVEDALARLQFPDLGSFQRADLAAAVEMGGCVVELSHAVVALASVGHCGVPHVCGWMIAVSWRGVRSI